MTIYPAHAANDLSTLLVLAHGAGAPQSHPFMVRYARGLAERGLEVATFNFPYMESGRKSPDKAPVLEEAFRRAIVDAVARRKKRPARVIIGGKSMGGRMATHLAGAPETWPREAPPLDGVVVLGYPLKAGKQDRVSHLLQIAVPTLIVQGTRDSFGGPDDVTHALRSHPLALSERQRVEGRITVYPVKTGDHSFAILKSSGKTQSQIDQEIWDHVIAWLPRPRTASAT